MARSQVLKQDGADWVRRANLLGRDVVVKCRALNTIGRWIKAAIGMGHGAKHWRGAARLKKAGVATGTPLALARADIGGASCEVLVLEFVPGKTLLEVLDEIARGVGPKAKAQHAIASAAGKTVGTMLLGKAWNRDHKPSNLIVMQRADEYEIAVIDCIGVQLWPWMGFLDDMDAIEAMMASMLIEPMGCGCAARRSLWVSAIRGLRTALACDDPRRNAPQARLKESRETLDLIKTLVKDHGDPTPKINPLARSQSSR